MFLFVTFAFGAGKEVVKPVEGAVQLCLLFADICLRKVEHIILILHGVEEQSDFPVKRIQLPGQCTDLEQRTEQQYTADDVSRMRHDQP